MVSRKITGFIVASMIAAGVAGCPSAPPTREELAEQCPAWCARYDGLASCATDREQCLDGCLEVAEDAGDCTAEAEAMYICADEQPDATICNPDLLTAACGDLVNAYLECQSAE